ncbi:MAG TPA: type II toxin-antitoxin system HicA family toxin [Nevskiaceae bacterium]|nr:type II toxin-antitoxin system HicA family toxin [Nevskiaceae bacterium]
MSKPPQVKSNELLKILKKEGFLVYTRKGSHITLKHPRSKKRVTIPYHKGKNLKPGTFHNIISHAGWTREEFLRLRKKRK